MPDEGAATGAGRPTRADARRNRERVLRAARDAFAQSGFGVPLDEIAARARVGPGTVYRHFPTKEALFQAVIEARLTDLAADARARASSDDPGGAFFGFLARLGDEAASKRDLSDAIDIPGPLRDALQEELSVLLRRAQQAGAVRADVTTPELIALLKGMMAGIREAAALPPDPARPGRFLAILSEGLRPSQAAGR
ncbi:MAG TPA: helix-turn-helix domain-containing protein [Streptosporangiaceae bacterium]